MLYKMDETLKCMTIQMRAIEQYFHDVFHVVRFIMLFKMVLTFKVVDETLVYDHSNAVLSCGTVYYANFQVCGQHAVVWPSYESY